jgi:flagellar basal body rod protein FlgG
MMMIAGIASALSGIQTGGKILSIGAHNIANAQTEGFKRTRALPVESSVGGVTVTLDKDVRPGPQIFSNEDPSTLREGSNVDLAEEIISNLQAVNLIEANIASVRIQDKVLGSLLDITE